MRRLWLCLVAVVYSRKDPAAPHTFPYSGEFVNCKRPGVPKCRAPRVYSDEALNHIAKLHVTDPYFYDVFSEEEIFSLFPDPATYHPKVPYDYYGDRELNLEMCSTERFNSRPFLQANQKYYERLKDHPWRSKKPALHIVANLNGYRCPKNNSVKFAEVFARLPQRAEFHQFHARNFLTIRSDWAKQVNAKRVAQKRFHGVPFVDAAARTWSEIPVSFNAYNYECVPCRSFSNYGSNPTAKIPEYYPSGALESYLYPEGMYAQMLKNRKRTLFLEANIEPKFHARKVALYTLSKLWPPNYLIQTKSKSHMGPPCTADFVEGCVKHKGLPGGFYERALNSIFGLHLMGDEFGSARLVDLGHTQTIPIIVMKEARQSTTPFPCFIPWNEMAITVSQAAFITKPAETIKSAIEPHTHNDLEKKLRLLYYYRPDFVDSLNNSRAHENTLVQAVINCLPPSEVYALRLNKLDFRCPFENENALATQLTRETDVDSPEIVFFP